MAVAVAVGSGNLVDVGFGVVLAGGFSGLESVDCSGFFVLLVETGLAGEKVFDVGVESMVGLGGVDTFWQAIMIVTRIIAIIPMYERLEFIERMIIVSGVLCDMY